jgi:4-hydroxythreonine-4-phosphate dehydrogenase
MKRNKKVIAVPMGDPSGIGPEIVLKALQHNEIKDRRIVVVGDEGIFRSVCESYNLDFHGSAASNKSQWDVIFLR